MRFTRVPEREKERASASASQGANFVHVLPYVQKISREVIFGSNVYHFPTYSTQHNKHYTLPKTREPYFATHKTLDANDMTSNESVIYVLGPEC